MFASALAVYNVLVFKGRSDVSIDIDDFRP